MNQKSDRLILYQLNAHYMIFLKILLISGNSLLPEFKAQINHTFGTKRDREYFNREFQKAE